MSNLVYGKHGQAASGPARASQDATHVSVQARREAGLLLRMLQKRQVLVMPHSRPMPGIGPRVHELRVNDDGVQWRLIYRTDDDAVVLVEVFKKTTQTTPRRVMETCRDRLKDYDQA